MLKFVKTRPDGGFSVHKDSTVPDGAVLITDEEYENLLSENYTFSGGEVVPL